jgi:hypothetical protein
MLDVTSKRDISILNANTMTCDVPPPVMNSANTGCAMKKTALLQPWYNKVSR